jgi:hypothetical protein
MEQQAQVWLGFGGAGEDDLAPVGCGQVHVDDLHGGELCQRAAGGEAGSEAVQPAGQGDLQAVGEEGDCRAAPKCCMCGRETASRSMEKSALWALVPKQKVSLVEREGPGWTVSLE